VRPLHITNGDSAGDKLRRIVDGEVTVTCDVLHEGPVPAVDGDAWYQTRGQFLAGAHGFSAEQLQDDLARWDAKVADAVSRGDEVVLWFEHDLFDQLLLIRTLDLLVGMPAPSSRSGKADTMSVGLICIDRFPGVERFIGLGQLSEHQLATLIGTERSVTAEQYSLAVEAWAAFRSPDPHELLAIAVGLPASRSEGQADTTNDAPLPFLRDALLRLLAEYPSAANGLTGTEQLALEALGAGPMTGWALFVATQAREPRPFMGDTTFFGIIGALASARVPLVAIAAAADEIDLRRSAVTLTDAGRDVVAGRRDRVALNGIDLWRGGVHLVGADRSPFRWDAIGERLVS
jgi:hypothetical protein